MIYWEKKSSSRSDRQNTFKKTSSTVGSFIQQKQGAVINLQEDVGYFRICLKNRRQAEACPVVPLKGQDHASTAAWQQ